MVRVLYLVLTAPSGPPSSVNAIDVTAFTITIQWGMVSCSAKNGNITGYSVAYMKIDSDGSEDSMTTTMNVMTGNTAGSDTNNDESRSVCNAVAETGSSSDDGHTRVVNVSTGLNVKLTGLQPSTNYSLTVTAYNSAGIGPPSEPLIVETDSELYNNTRSKILFLLNRSVNSDKCLFIECISQHLMDSGSWSDSYQLYTNLPQH